MTHSEHYSRLEASPFVTYSGRHTDVVGVMSGKGQTRLTQNAKNIDMPLGVHRTMPRYTFHVENGHRISSDEVTLRSREAARLEAEGIAQDLAQNRSSRDKSRVVATDATGIQVAEAPILHKKK